jgi:RNA polymerase sigma-70 factor, ECF subfamily
MDSPPEREASPTNGHSNAPRRRAMDTDQDIVELFQARKYDKALVMLMDRHEHGVFRFCCTLLSNEELAKDVTQIAFIHAHRDMSTFAGRSTLKSWLFAIARNRARDAGRGPKVDKLGTPLDEFTSLRLEDSARSPDMRISDIELAEALRGCLEALNEAEIAAVLLRYQQDMSFEEMSQVTGEKPGTLQARVARAVEKVRRCIEKKTGGNL